MALARARAGLASVMEAAGMRRANAEEVAVDYRVLGPLDVRVDDVPLSLGARKQAADYVLSST